jgi:hypothetical protein
VTIFLTLLERKPENIPKQKYPTQLRYTRLISRLSKWALLVVSSAVEKKYSAHLFLPILLVLVFKIND